MGATLSAFAEDQPHMQAALDALQRAKQELQSAEHDKGGHRERALDMVNRAIQQTQAGMRFDTKHEKNDKDRDKDRDKR